MVENPIHSLWEKKYINKVKYLKKYKVLQNNVFTNENPNIDEHFKVGMEFQSESMTEL